MADTQSRSRIIKPTQKTVAEKSGFAVTTVSRALAGDPLIAKKTRDKITQAARDLGYVPDRAAQRLRTGRTRVIALVLDPHGEILDFAGSMISGFADVVRGTPYHLNLTQYQLGEDPLTPIRHIVSNRLADGVVFARTEPRDPRVSYLLEQNFPFVTHGRTELGPHAWYDYDNAAFAALAVKRLADLGRRRLLLIPPAARYSFAGHMVAGFRRAVADAGTTGILPDSFDLNTPSGDLHRALMGQLTGPTPPDGVICPGEVAAMAALAAVQDTGLILGRDLDLLAKQTSRVFDLYRPRVETIQEDIGAAGRTMAEALMAQIDGAAPDRLQTLQAPPSA